MFQLIFSTFFHGAMLKREMWPASVAFLKDLILNAVALSAILQVDEMLGFISSAITEKANKSWSITIQWLGGSDSELGVFIFPTNIPYSMGSQGAT